MSGTKEDIVYATFQLTETGDTFTIDKILNISTTDPTTTTTLNTSGGGFQKKYTQYLRNKNKKKNRKSIKLKTRK